MRHVLIIKPAVSAIIRDKIQDILRKEGYHIVESGARFDMSCCDISFDGPDPRKPDIEGYGFCVKSLDIEGESPENQQRAFGNRNEVKKPG